MNYTKFTIEEIVNKLKFCLNEERFEHSLGTMECAKELAQKFNSDCEKAQIAALLHDCAKCLDKSVLKQIISENHLDDDYNCEGSSKVWHAPVSAYLAKNEYGITDVDILNAIKWHTVGRINMSLLEKIVYIADKIEHRTREPEYRQPVEDTLNETNSLDNAILTSFKLTICSLTERNLPICQQTIDVYNELLKDY